MSDNEMYENKYSLTIFKTLSMRSCAQLNWVDDSRDDLREMFEFDTELAFESSRDTMRTCG